MNTLLAVLLPTVVLLAMPLLLGLSFRSDRDAGIAMRYISGSFVMLCAMQVATLVLRFFSWDFERVSISCWVLLGLIGILTVIFARDRLFYVSRERMRLNDGSIVFGILLLVQLVAVFCAKKDVLNDTTAETIQTILYTNSVNEVNPVTGLEPVLPMSTLPSLTALPVFYASLVYVTGADVSFLLYRIVPMLVLLLSYTVYGLLGRALFDSDRKRSYFLVLLSLLNIFGCFSDSLMPYQLLHRGFAGDTIAFAVIFPFMIYIAVTGGRRSTACEILFLALSVIAACATAGVSLGIGLSTIPGLLYVILLLWRWRHG